MISCDFPLDYLSHAVDDRKIMIMDILENI